MFKYQRLRDQASKYKYKLRGGDYVYDLAPCFADVDGCVTNDTPPYVSVQNCRLNIRNGYEWDGATYFPDFKWVLRASLVHDALCQLLKDGHWTIKAKNDARLRQCADREFYCIVREDKGPRWASVTYSAIRGHMGVPFVGGILAGAFGLFRRKPMFECGEEVLPVPSDASADNN